MSSTMIRAEYFFGRFDAFDERFAIGGAANADAGAEIRRLHDDGVADLVLDFFD